MRLRFIEKRTIWTFAAAAALLACCGFTAPFGPSALPSDPLTVITVDYPLDATVFPPEITPPEFLWHDPAGQAHRWVVEFSFAGRPDRMKFDVAGELLKRGDLDPDAGLGVALSAVQASTRTWRPDAGAWERIKQLSMHGAATMSIRGFAGSGAGLVAAATVSLGEVSFSTSADPVGAPIFYRDVPLLLPSPEEKGPIQPLPQAALPLIKWQIRNIAEPHSKVVMGNMPTCANCHSFSRDGKTMGLDLDGPRNDKGLYALLPVEKAMTISNRNVIRWSAFQVDDGDKAAGAGTSTPSVKRFGFMSQVSPDGRYVVTSIGPPKNGNANQGKEPGFAPGILDRLYSTNFRSIEFSQVFYPTRGILAWYDREAKTMRPLPGADDPRYVQTSAFWSSDGKYLIYSRALARDPYPPGAPKPEFANSPNETQIQYDLYRIPFNEGRGGTSVPVEGASNNGMSNNFPKVSPDGKWIVWVENRNGLLMRPDSRLFIVPFAGGKARLMNCNLRPMNSWHSFSPNGHWLAFSSKARGPYTRLMLTHIDADGKDAPAVIVDNTTAANRAVNIPEFVNVPQGGLQSIDPQATEFYRLFDEAFKLMEAGQIQASIGVFEKAIERDPDDALAHYVMGTALSANDEESKALGQYAKAVSLDGKNATFLDHLAISMSLNGDQEGAVAQLEKAIALDPETAEYRFNLGMVAEQRGDFARAVPAFEKAVALSRERNWRGLDELAKAYAKMGRFPEAAEAGRKALALVQQSGDEQAARRLGLAIEGYTSAAGAKSP